MGGRAGALAVLLGALLALAAPTHGQSGATDRAGGDSIVPVRTMVFPAEVVAEFASRGEAFLPGAGLNVRLGEGIVARAGERPEGQARILIVDGEIVGLATDAQSGRILSSADIEMTVPLDLGHPGAARFGGPILLISTRNAPSRPRRGQALLIVDGVIRGGSISRLVPERIESIRILRGEAAIARFGLRASAGAILITTKREP